MKTLARAGRRCGACCHQMRWQWMKRYNKRGDERSRQDRKQSSAYINSGTEEFKEEGGDNSDGADSDLTGY